MNFITREEFPELVSFLDGDSNDPRTALLEVYDDVFRQGLEAAAEMADKREWLSEALRFLNFKELEKLFDERKNDILMCYIYNDDPIEVCDFTDSQNMHEQDIREIIANCIADAYQEKYGKKGNE